MLRSHPKNRRNLLLLLLALGWIEPRALQAQEIIHVPADRSTLQSAIGAVHEGGVIEMAAGNYAAPSGAFTIYDTAKGFTIRATAGASVVLSGEGTHDIIRFGNPSVAQGRPVTFQGLTFSGGLSNTDAIGGVFTLTHAEAIFLSCTFENNAATPAASSGVLWLYDAVVSFQQCIFANNSSRNYGGAISAVESRVFLRQCSFIGNRVNVPNHTPSSVGGAIFNSNSSIHADNCRFENNQASYVSGAIYCGGTWRDPLSEPTAELVISNSIFIGNSATRDPAVPFAPDPIGGAIHLEDQTTGKFVNCRFEDNHAAQGGAISSYRALIEVTGCVFKGNYVAGSGSSESIGGSIFATSSDVVDPSTGNGTINRRSTQVDIRDSIFRGKADGSPDARQGGVIFVLGDENAAYGLNGVQQNGTVASNRALLTLTRVAFADTRATDAGGTSGTGGAVSGLLASLNIDSSIFQNCVAGYAGGALEALGNSSVLMTKTTVSGCRASSLGGAIALFGGSLNITQSNFVQNQLTGGSNGSVLITAPSVASGGVPDLPVTGLIANCVFSNNSSGATIFEGDRDNPPFNLLQYSGNTIFSSPNGVPFDSDHAPASTVAQLNQLVIHHSDGSNTIKAPAPANVAPASAPAVGALLMIPPTVLQSGAPGEALPIPSNLAYTSSGGSVALDGTARASSSGVVPTSVNGVHTLTVGSSSVATVPPPAAALNISTRLPVGIGQEVLIGGLIIVGPSAKTVMIRAIGPSLPLAGALQDPVLELHDGTGAIIAANNNWRSTQIGGVIASDQAILIQATEIAPTNDAEAAIVATLEPNVAYTAVVHGANNGTGIALVEAYDLDPVQTSTLANISTRGFIQTGNNVMIGGFIMGGGTGATRVVVRGIGPSLGASGITNPLADPMLELHDANGTTIDANDDWRTNQAAIQGTGLQPTNDAESAILLTNPAPGAYTAVLRGKNNGTGVGVVEAYVFE